MIGVTSPRTPNRRGRGEQLRHDLVAAARDSLIAPREVAPFSLRAVAKAVGVSPTAVYRHFESADSLIVAVLEDQNDALRRALGAAGSDSVDVSTLRDAALRYVEWGLANPGAYQLLFESADRIGHRGGPGSPGWDMIERLAAMLATTLQVDEPTATLMAIRAWSHLHGLTSLRLHKPAMQWPTTVEEEVAIIANALVASEDRVFGYEISADPATKSVQQRKRDHD